MRKPQDLRREDVGRVKRIKFGLGRPLQYRTCSIDRRPTTVLLSASDDLGHIYNGAFYDIFPILASIVDPLVEDGRNRILKLAVDMREYVKDVFSHCSEDG